MSRQVQRVFDTAFKESLMLRLAAGETMAALLKETGILRKSLYEWRDAYRKLGVAGLNQRRGPKPGGGREHLAMNWRKHVPKSPNWSA